MATLQGYTEDEVDILIDEYTLKVQDALERACVATADAIPNVITADGLTAASANDADIVIVKWTEQVDDDLVPYVASVYSGSATQVAIAAGDAFPDDLMPGVPLVADEYAIEYLKTVTSRYSGVGNELWETIRAELIDGVQKGQSIEQIKARIMAAARLDPKLARRIARTEVHSAAEAGSIAQMRYMGYADDEVTKEWLSAHDLKTRQSHVIANGQKVAMNAKFVVGGWSLDYPGDPSGPDGEVENCRCSQSFEVGKPPPFRCGGVLVAAPPPPSATACIVPIKPADIGMFTSTQLNAIFNEWLKHAFSPSYGGKKIHESLVATRAALKAKDPALEAILSDEQILTIADKLGTMKLSYVSKYGEWAQSPAGMKVIGVKTPIKAVKIPLQAGPPPSVTPATIPVPKSLPPVAPKPAVSDLEFTGKILSGATKAQVWVDKKTGQKWIIKFPQGGSYSAKFLIDLEEALARVQSKALLTRPALYNINVNGKYGSIQFMFDSKEAFPGGKFSVAALSDEDLFVFQREQIFDWMISNHDTHSGQWLRLPDGTLIGIDKGQAFKFFGQDKLDWDYIPVTPLGSDKLTYSQIWKAYVSGQDVHVQDPTQGELGAFIDRLMSIDDDEYRKLLEPYAIQRAKLFGGDAKKFLDQAVARKNNLKKDFADFWARAQAARAKKLGVPVPSPTPIAPAVSTVAPGTTTKLTSAQVTELVKAWMTLGGGKKVTPGWGGAKIFKMLDSVKKSGILPPSVTHRQIMQELDDALGFAGKTKTYETAVDEWLASPQSTNTLLQMGYHSGNLPGDLKPQVPKVYSTKPVTPVSPTPPPTPPAPTTVATPIKPITGPTTDAAADALATGQKVSNAELMAQFSVAADGDIIGYTEMPGGFTLRAVAVKTPHDTHLRLEIRQPGATAWTPHGTKYYSASYLDKIFGPGQQWSKPSLIVDEVDAVLASPTKSTVAGVWASLSNYSDGDVIAYVKMANGDVIRLRRGTSPSGTTWIEADRRLLGETSWSDEANFWSESDLEGFYHKKGVAAWSPVPSKSPPPAAVGSKIPGKTTGDSVSWAEIAASKYLWSDGDEIASVTDALGFKTRIISDGKGGVRLEMKSPSDNNWQLIQHMSPSDVDYAGTSVKGDLWKLGPDALHVKVSKSPIVSKNVGDAVSSIDVMQSFSFHSDGTVLAYGTGPHNPTVEFRIVRKGSGISIEGRVIAKGGAWQEMDFIADPWNDPKLSKWIGSAEWRAAKLNGDAPDEHELAKIPAGIFGTKPPPSATTTTVTKWGPGWTPGQAVHWSEVADQNVYANFDEYEVIATGTLKSLGLEYRAYRIGDTVVYEQRVTNGTWFAQGDITKATKKIDWQIAPAGTKVSSVSSVAKENAKKATAVVTKTAAKKTVKKAAVSTPSPVAPITTPVTSLPTKQFVVPKGGVKWAGTPKGVGDKVVPDEIRAIAVNHPEYEIIAEGLDTSGFEYRVYRIGDMVFAESRDLKNPNAVWADLGEFVDAPNFNAVKWSVPLGGKVDPKSVSVANNAKLLTPVRPPKLTTPAPAVGGPPPTPTKADAIAAKKAAAAAKKAEAIAKKAQAAAKKAQYQVPPPTAKALSGTQTHVPGKQTGDVLTPDAIYQYGSAYDDGTIIATGKDWYGEYRIVRVDGKTIYQKKTKAGNWTGTSEVTSKYFSGYNTKWIARNDKLTDKEYASAKKSVEKLYAPVTPKKSYGSSSAYSSTGTTPAQLPHVDLSPWSDTEQDEIFQWIKQTYPSLAAHNKQYVWAAIQAAKWHFQKKYGGKYAGLNEIEILRIYDLYRAKSKGIAATDHKFEIAIVDWLKTSDGKSFVSRRIDAPIAAVDVPVPMSDFASSSIPIDKQTYSIWSTSEAKSHQSKSWAKYGEPSATAKSAWHSYSGPGSAWNEAIRKGDISSYAAKIKAAVNGMRPSLRAVLLHRGTDFSELNDPSIVDFSSLLSHVGQTYMNRGFNSTSVGGSAAFSSKPLLLEIEAPIGTPMAYIQEWSGYSNEREMLLPPHLIYQIISVTKKGSQTVMRVRIIGVAQP